MSPNRTKGSATTDGENHAMQPNAASTLTTTASCTRRSPPAALVSPAPRAHVVVVPLMPRFAASSTWPPSTEPSARNTAPAVVTPSSSATARETASISAHCSGDPVPVICQVVGPSA